jgi:hypothetical protein
VRTLGLVNLALRFFLELAALAALGFWGFHEHSGAAAWLLGIGAPLAAAVLWGAVVAPKRAFQVGQPGRLAGEVVVVVAAVAALAAADQAALAAALGAAWAVNRLLLWVAGRAP